MDEQKLSAVFKALGDENRIRILKLLRSGEKCACKLLEELNISQPTLSHHMKILCDAGIVTGRKAGKWTHYAICREGIRTIRALLQDLLSPESMPADCNCQEGGSYERRMSDLQSAAGVSSERYADGVCHLPQDRTE